MTSCSACRGAPAAIQCAIGPAHRCRPLATAAAFTAAAFTAAFTAAAAAIDPAAACRAIQRMGISAADVEARLRSELAATDVSVHDIAGCAAAAAAQNAAQRGPNQPPHGPPPNLQLRHQLRGTCHLATV